MNIPAARETRLRALLEEKLLWNQEKGNQRFDVRRKEVEGSEEDDMRHFTAMKKTIHPEENAADNPLSL